MTDYRTKNRPLSNNVSAHCFRYIFNLNDQNIGPLSLSPSLPLSLISFSPSLLLSFSPSLLLSFSPSLPLSLYPTLTLSLSPHLPFSFSHSPYFPLFLYPSLFISLSFSTSLPLYFSTSLPSPSLEPEQATPVATEPATTTLVVIISYQGNHYQDYPGNQLLEFL